MSRVYHSLQAEYEAWKARRLPDRYVYVFADGTYFSVIYGDEAHTTPILALVGITAAGRRELIAFTTGERENQAAWENRLDDLRARGVQHVDRGSLMVIRRCSMPLRSSSPPASADAASSVNWRTSWRMCRPNSATRWQPSASTSPTAQPPISRRPPSVRNIRRCIRPPSRGWIETGRRA